MMSHKLIKLLIVCHVIFISTLPVFADTTVDLFQSYAGNVNFVGVEATRRTQSNNGNACAVLGENTNNSATVSGIPAGATIRAAHLYWAGSGPTPDYTVTFEGSTVTAPTNRQYTADYASTYYFFSGVADVTSQVNTKRNGTYNFSGLTVSTVNPYCSAEGVLAGWSLVIIYEAPGEDFRVVNLYEGFQAFRDSSITLTPDNFRTPNSGINGKHATLTWEGDNSLNNDNENLVFNGNALVDSSNPLHAQFNSISNIRAASPSTGSVNNNSYGVDFDVFDISSYLSGGETSATSTYSSGTDLVLLSSEIISVTNTPVSDLNITKTATSSFSVGSNATYNIAVNNIGPNIEPGNIVVTDTLPTGLSYVSATGSGWNCSASGQNVTCTRTGNLAVGSSTSVITLTVAVGNSASPSISNTASVSGTNFDNVTENNDSTATTTVSGGTTPAFTVGQCEYFENGLSNWILSNPARAAITNLTSLSPTHSLDMFNGASDVTSIAVNTSSNFDELSLWLRRGADSFSENPNGDDDILIQYLNSSNNWVTLGTFDGGGTAGQIYNLSYTMPTAAKHPNFRVRIRNTGNDRYDSPPSDHWHIDDICLIAANELPTINLKKTSSTISDPINGNVNPKAIPGAIAEYAIMATNSGAGVADNNSIVITDTIPANTALYVEQIWPGIAPVRFMDGSPSSGLTLGSVSYFNSSNVSITPSPDADGVDTNVASFRVTTSGQFNATSASGDPWFEILFRVKVQ
ncbi:hypothetical protein [uncultured Cocleimonas sp.]|uniref:hypothetical protein n=1 Tax=uncultured Cocleimonas sp. TaxID=1051587 RepID=UPI00261F5B2B|nr:hypothetical protein [uncultured Cocleimonas sp.]